MANSTYHYCPTCKDAPTIHTCTACGCQPPAPCYCPGCGPQCATHPPTAGSPLAAALGPFALVGLAHCATHPQHPACGPALVAWVQALLPLCNRPGNPQATRKAARTVLAAARLVAKCAAQGQHPAPVAGGCVAQAHAAALAAGVVACAMCHVPHLGYCPGTAPAPGAFTWA